MKDSTILHIVAIVSITALEITNLVVTGTDGALLTTTIVIVAGLGGYAAGRAASNMVTEFKR